MTSVQYSNRHRLALIACCTLATVLVIGACSSDPNSSADDDAGGSTSGASNTDDGMTYADGDTVSGGTTASDGGGSSSDGTATGSDGSSTGDAGGGSTDANSLQEPFVGSWKQNSGEGTIACNGSSEELTSGAEGTISAKGSSELVFDTDRGCTWTFRVQGGQAGFDPPGQTCETTEDGTAVTIKPNRWLIELTCQDGLIRQRYQTIKEKGSGSSAVTCEVQWSGTIERE